MGKTIIYEGICTEAGKVVESDYAFEYAMRNCGIELSPDAETAPEFEEFKEAFVDWYFSGEWMKVQL